MVTVRSSEERFPLVFNISYPTASYLDAVAMFHDSKMIKNVARQIIKRNVSFSRLRVLQHYIPGPLCTIVFEITSDLYLCDDLCTNNEFAYLVGNGLTSSLDSGEFLETLKYQSFSVDTFKEISSTDIQVEFDFNFDVTYDEPATPFIDTPPCKSDEFEYSIEVFTDTEPQETSWKFAYEDGAMIEEVERGKYDIELKKFKHRGCASNSCLVFTIEDLGSDGICCEKGVGSYVIYAGNEIEVNSNQAKLNIFVIIHQP